MNSNETQAVDVSLRAYARHRDVALSAVQKAIATGRIKKTPLGKINVAEADRAWALNTDIARLPPDTRLRPAPDEGEDEPEEGDVGSSGAEYQRHRANRERIRAQKEQIELDMLSARTLDLAEAKRMVFTAFRTIRDAVVNVSPRIKDALAAETDPLKIEKILETELTNALLAIDLSTVLNDNDDEDTEDGGD